MERLFPHFRPAQIAFVAGLALCLIDEAIAGPPKATTSQYFKTYAAGFSWVRTGEGSATLELDVLPDAQKALFVEVAFPNPDNPQSPLVVRKQVARSMKRVSFESPRISGWRNRKHYVFVARVYGDPRWQNLLGEHKQEVECHIPPKSYLQQLGEPTKEP